MYKKLLFSGGMLAFSSVYQQIVGILVVVQLSFYLSPEDFGVVAVISIFNAFCALFANLGLGQAIIFNDKVSDAQKNTLFFLGLSFGFVTFLIIYFLAPYAYVFFEYPNIESLILLSSLVFLIRPFFILQRRMLEKEMRFYLLSIVDAIAVTIAGLAAIIYAYIDRSVEALIVQSLMVNLVYLFVFFVIGRRYWVPGFEFSNHRILDMVKYSIRYKIGETAQYFEKNIDLIVFSRMFGASDLGYYSFVVKIVMAPVKKMSQIVVSVLFPFFSKIKNDSPEYKLLLMLEILIAFFSPVIGIVLASSDVLVEYLFDEKWYPIKNILPIMIVAAFFQGLDSMVSIYYPAVGIEKLYAKVSLMKFFLTFFLILIGGFLGLYWAVIFYLIAKLINLMGGIFVLIRKTGVKSKRLLKFYFVALFSMFLSFYCFLLFDNFLGSSLTISVLCSFFGVAVLLMYEAWINRGFKNV